MTAEHSSRVLVVEDEYLLAMLLVDDLQAAGFVPLGPFSTLETALEASRRLTFDMATLDVNLNGQWVYPLADELLTRGIPFLFLTGYAPADMPEKFRALPRLTKPYDAPVLERRLRLLGG
ncbi:response regulator [Aminobacter anthyllidis]|uniref:Response regulator n=1 Tax=Aminobacter anthyllidis TaxID=1035067 RepID=A0A9X1AHP8_9HYPH|nr:response regulator [Aminobacter anthyllidis]MBT1160180.1 response regulator [Aminobacter anthyllidis]